MPLECLFFLVYMKKLLYKSKYNMFLPYYLSIMYCIYQSYLYVRTLCKYKVGFMYMYTKPPTKPPASERCLIKFRIHFFRLNDYFNGEHQGGFAIATLQIVHFIILVLYTLYVCIYIWMYMYLELYICMYINKHLCRKYSYVYIVYLQTTRL